MTLPMHDLIEALLDQVIAEAAEGHFYTGGQLYVSVAGQPIVDLAVGVDALGRPVRTDTLFALYCAGKPVVATAVGCLIEDGELSLHDRVGDIVEDLDLGGTADLLVGELLNHTAGLHLINARHYLLCSERHRDELVAGCPRPRGWRTGADVAYSEVAAWHVLGWVINALAGETTRSLLRRRVLEPLQLDNDLFVAGMDDDTFATVRGRLGINIWLAGIRSDPLLIEQTRRFRCTPNLALGTTGSAQSLGRFYDGLRAIASSHGGGAQDVVLSMQTIRLLTTASSHGFDPIMQRECGYASGFMVGLEEHFFGRRCGPDAFGHSGNGGMTAALCDPARDLVIAFHFNGRVDAESAVMFRRPALLERIYSAVLDAGG